MITLNVQARAYKNRGNICMEIADTVAVYPDILRLIFSNLVKDEVAVSAMRKLEGLSTDIT